HVFCHNIRDYSLNKHHRADDYAYGGGKGMVMTAQPVCDCFKAIRAAVPTTRLIYLSPKGKKLTQNKAKKLLKYENITLLCGHYEGIDQRALDLIVDEELSIGDYVLTGGELAAMIVVDTVSRMVDGVLADRSCFEDESIYSGLLEYPQYTRPAEYEGIKVPEVLINGHHANIKKWRFEQSLIITKEKRKDLYHKYNLKQNPNKF
ncbi:MAG: tRNA (guanine-N1)-methyltransferase, partial [Clostridia bacterium]|nr:tRNA (guanine-N1)-methyltransferase [Clostridia bacterium]